jgi:hypothetical protein
VYFIAISISSLGYPILHRQRIRPDAHGDLGFTAVGVAKQYSEA